MPPKDPNEAFGEAFFFGDLEAAKSIYAAGGVDLSRPDAGSGFTYLHTACRLGSVEAVRWLLGEGVDVDSAVGVGGPDDDDWGEVGATPLMLVMGSIAGHQRELVDLLLEAGADVNKVDNFGRSVVHFALNTPALLDVVLSAGADPNRPDNKGQTPLMVATRRGLHPAMDRLRRAGAGDDGMVDVELIEAALAGNHEAFAACLANGANVNYQSDGTALTIAVDNGDAELLRQLLAAGADVDLPETDSPDGDFNPLLRAAYAGNLDLLRLLLEAGADVNVTNRGITALDYAKMGETERRKADRPWDEITTMLREPGRAARATLRGESVGDGDSAIVDALNGELPDALDWSRYLAGGVEILESAAVADVEFLRHKLPALQATARANGYGLGVVTHSLRQVEPRLDDVSQGLAAAAATTADEVFTDWEEERLNRDLEFDDGDDDFLWPQRQRALSALTEMPTSAEPGPLRVEPGHLVLTANGLTALPIVYRFGGWNSAPLPHEMGLVLQHWHDSHGAEVVSMGDAAVTLRLPEPLGTVDQVREAARQIGLFCDESQSADDDIRIAALDQWLFWWD